VLGEAGVALGLHPEEKSAPWNDRHVRT